MLELGDALNQLQDEVDSARSVIRNRRQNECHDSYSGGTTVAISPITYHQRFSSGDAELLQRVVEEPRIGFCIPCSKDSV